MFFLYVFDFQSGYNCRTTRITAGPVRKKGNNNRKHKSNKKKKNRKKKCKNTIVQGHISDYK